MTYILDFCLVITLLDVPVEIWVSVNPEKLILLIHDGVDNRKENKKWQGWNLQRRTIVKPVKNLFNFKQ